MARRTTVDDGQAEIVRVSSCGGLGTQTKAKEGTMDRRQREMDRRNAQRPWTDLKRRVDDICGPSHAADDVDVSDLERPQRAESGVDIPPTVRVGSQSAQ